MNENAYCDLQDQWFLNRGGWTPEYRSGIDNQYLILGFNPWLCLVFIIEQICINNIYL